MRNSIVALAALVLIPAGLWADETRTQVREIRGQVKSVDATKNTVTVLVGDQERILQCAPTCRVSILVTTRGRLPRRTFVQERTTTLSQLGQGNQVTITTETQNNSEMVTQIRQERGTQTTTSNYRPRRGILRRA